MKNTLITLGLLAACACSGNHETKAASPSTSKSATSPSSSMPTTVQPIPVTPPSSQPKADLPKPEMPKVDNAPVNVAGEADRALETRIRQTLSSDAALAATIDSVTIAAKEGTVTLSGSVATQADKDALLAKIKALPGVTSCDDQIEVRM